MVELHKILSKNDTNDNSRYASANDTDNSPSTESSSPSNETDVSVKESEGGDNSTTLGETVGASEGVKVDHMDEALNDAVSNSTSGTDIIDSAIGQLNNTDLSPHHGTPSLLEMTPFSY